MTLEIVKYIVSAFILTIVSVYVYRYKEKVVGYIVGLLAFIPDVNFILAFIVTFLVFVYSLIISINIIMDKFEK